MIRSVDSGRLIDQHAQLTLNTELNGEICVNSQAMHQVRIPLADFCDQDTGFDPAALTAVRLRFDESQQAHAVLVDSLELTRDPTDAGTPPCGHADSDWDCVAMAALLATETSCSSEPKPNCRPSSVRTNPVALPFVDDGLGGGYSGWVVHASWLRDPQNPTQAEIDGLLDACVAACELEWSDNPDISATCSATGAFQTPTLRTAPGLGPVHRIPTTAEHGEGLFTGQSLSCNLEGDCCAELDEDLCAARGTRGTAAGQPLERGEEVRVNVGTSASKATFITPGGSVVMPLVGSAGYSLCPDGETATCPFYVGSLSVSGTTSVTVTDTCPDQSAFSAQVTDFDLELLQPAFGIDDSGSISKAFPRGALHLRGFITVDGQSYQIRAVNEAPVYLSASTSGFFAGNMDIAFDAPCGGGPLPVTLRIELRHNGNPIGRPPAIDITMPSSLACGAKHSLTQSSSDPDGDLASVRWYVDDVLMAPGVTTLWFSQAHTLRAVARDARGATTTDVATVSCLPS